MNTVEKLIARYTVERLIDGGYTLAVEDEEGERGERTTDVDKIVNALGETDDERIYTHTNDGNDVCNGCVRFIYGNGNNGLDVVCDYTTNLEPQMDRVSGYVDGLEAMRVTISNAFK